MFLVFSVRCCSKTLHSIEVAVKTSDTKLESVVEGSLSQDYKGITLRQLFVPHFPPFYRHGCVHTSILDRPRHIRSFLTTRRARSGKSSYQNHTPLETAIWKFPNSALARPWMSLDPRTCFFSINDGCGSFESPKVNSMR